VSLCLCASVLYLQAQDPHFSQFFMAPHLIDPATTAMGGGDWRFIANYRQQWGNAGTPFNTMTATMEYKILGREEDQNVLGIGATFMADESMNGAFKSIYASGALAYQVRMNNTSSIALGIQSSYGNRSLDYSRLTFGEQFTNGGFDVSLPTGETALTNMKPFVSVGAGLLYSYRNERLNIDLGAAGFHFNKPKQTFISDPYQFVPRRYVGHFSLTYEASKLILVNMNSVFQQQATQQYFCVGGSLGLDVSNGDRQTIIFGGAWYRQRDAMYPFLSLYFGSVQLGFSYDVTTSKQLKGPYTPQSFEMSLIIKQKQPVKGEIPCPW
jgi:type IX secretion system PorP/SprF family membrane protein